MPKPTFNETLESAKRRLCGHALSLDEAISHAFVLLEDSHRHDINEALDVYHNTLLTEIQRLYEEHENEHVPHVH